MNYLKFKVQSNSADPIHVREKTDEFIANFIEKFENGILQEEFSNAVVGLTAAYKTPYRNNSQILNLLANQIRLEQFEYDVKNNAIGELAEIKFEDFVSWGKKLLGEGKNMVEMHHVAVGKSEIYEEKLVSLKEAKKDEILFVGKDNFIAVKSGLEYESYL